MSGLKIFDPKNDWVFKNLFMQEEIFISFAKSALRLREDDFLEIQFLNTETMKEDVDDKLCRLDVKVKIKGLGYVMVEMQMSKVGNFEKRSLFYWANSYFTHMRELTERGEKNYDNLIRCSSINVLNYHHFPQCTSGNSPAPFFTTHRVFCEELSKYTFSDFDIRFIELPKFWKNGYNDIKGWPDLDKWALFLKEPTEPVLEKIAMQGETYQQAVDRLIAMSKDPKQKEAYEARLKGFLDLSSAQSYAMREGRAEGKIAGKIEGKIEGEHIKAIEIAKKLKNRGFSLEIIAEDSGLTLEEVKAL